MTEISKADSIMYFISRQLPAFTVKTLCLVLNVPTEQQIIFWVIGYFTNQNNFNCVNTSQN